MCEVSEVDKLTEEMYEARLSGSNTRGRIRKTRSEGMKKAIENGQTLH